ncbi:MAG: hypothetical protein P8N09_13390 [Planctomycetota bacterium]|nr:hypothetical protein [Planctomycetota bacterium]
MISAHTVFLVYLAVAMAWNLHASSRKEGETQRPLSQRVLVPLLALLTAVLIRDRWIPNGEAWLTTDTVRHLFPLAFLATLIQNTHVIVHRGARLSDIPLVLFNVGVGGAVTVADLSLSGVPLGQTAETLLYDHSVLQLLLGSPFAQSWTLSWHLPFLLRRSEPRSVLDYLGGLLPATLAAFGAVILVSFHSSAEQVLATFADEPRQSVGIPAKLALGVTARPEGPQQPGAPGTLRSWVLPADHDGQNLPPDDGRPLVLELRAPDAWSISMPGDTTNDATPHALREQVFLEGAERLARKLHPAVLLPFPEPDGEATRIFGASQTPQQWAARIQEVAERLATASPQTAMAVRLRGHGERSRALFEALAPYVAIMGPRLEPGGDNREHVEQRGADLADTVLESWRVWRSALDAPPRWWILAAGCSPLAVGERAQQRFLEGCLARAVSEPEVEALLMDGLRDRGHTLGLIRPDGQPREAGRWALRLLDSQGAALGR